MLQCIHILLINSIKVAKKVVQKHSNLHIWQLNYAQPLTSLISLTLIFTKPCILLLLMYVLSIWSCFQPLWLFWKVLEMDNGISFVQPELLSLRAIKTGWSSLDWYISEKLRNYLLLFFEALWLCRLFIISKFLPLILLLLIKVMKIQDFRDQYLCLLLFLSSKMSDDFTLDSFGWRFENFSTFLEFL